jgi:lipopolysaccharide export LptBFGC system permease protein LptF
MTIDKSKTVTLPVWLVSVIVSLLVTGFTTWGILTSTKATLEIRAARNEREIESLRQEKVNRTEFTMVLEKLNTIERKLDTHTVDDFKKK